ncbi:MAG: SDR family NAD(P)-dependent oxidoreductase [Terracidiphilus sp.]
MLLFLTKAVLPHFRRQRGGHFIQVTSIAGRLGPIGRAPYGAGHEGICTFVLSATLTLLLTVPKWKRKQ